MNRTFFLTLLMALVAGASAAFAAVEVTPCEGRYLAGRAIPKRVERWVCADPALAALERGVFKTFVDGRKADEWGTISEENDLRIELEKCQDARCVADRYQFQLDVLAESGPFPLSHGRVLRPIQRKWRSTIWSRDIGGGWYMFRFDIDNGPLREPLPDNWAGQGFYEGHEMFVAQVVDGKSQYRRSDGNGFDIEVRKDGTWKVTQVGECQCANVHGLSYTGIYR